LTTTLEHHPQICQQRVQGRLVRRRPRIAFAVASYNPGPPAACGTRRGGRHFALGDGEDVYGVRHFVAGDGVEVEVGGVQFHLPQSLQSQTVASLARYKEDAYLLLTNVSSVYTKP